MTGGTCSTHGRDEKTVQFYLEMLKGRSQVEDLFIDGRTILIRYKTKNVWAPCDWIRRLLCSLC
jgi:hypothetical protein